MSEREAGPDAGATDIDLALSTMYAQRWSNENGQRLPEFFAAGKRMGFQHFELSHILAAEEVAAIDPILISVRTLHHPCPHVHSPPCAPWQTEQRHRCSPHSNYWKAFEMPAASVQ